jgi:3-oxoacyl-[acyl-carrier-protein] synthase III
VRRAEIIGTGSHLPGEPLTNERLAALCGPLPDEVLSGLGVKRRHWIADPETGEHLESNSDMAYLAAVQALEGAGVDAKEVELLVVSTSSPDYLLPPMATMVQDRLGVAECAILDVRSGCAGAMAALDIARLYIENGTYRTAVVVGSEVISPLLVPIYRGKDPDSLRARDRLSINLFGDGAGAIVLRGSEGDVAGAAGILHATMASVGGGKKPGMQIVGAGTHAPIHRQLEAARLVDLRIDIAETARMSPKLLTMAVRRTLAGARVTAGEVAVCVIPEGDPAAIQDELRSAGEDQSDWAALEGRIVGNLATVGATGSGAMPLSLHQAWAAGRIGAGDLVLIAAAETSKWIYAGALVRWSVAAPVAKP